MSQRKRCRLLWQAFWTPEIEKWTIAKIRENKWRFDAAEDVDDLLQDARILFLKIQTRYTQVTEAPHLFALFRTSLMRQFIDKSRLKQRSVIDQTLIAEEVAEEKMLHSTMPNLGLSRIILNEMPDELKLVLGVLTTGRVRLKLDRPSRVLRRRETANMRVKRRLSLLTANPVGELKAYLTQL